MDGGGIDLITPTEAHYSHTQRNRREKGMSAGILESIEAWKTKGQSRAFGVGVGVSHPNGGNAMTINREMPLADQ